MKGLNEAIGKKVKIKTTMGMKKGTIVSFYPHNVLVQFDNFRECFSIIDIKKALGLPVLATPVEEIKAREHWTEEQDKYLINSYGKMKHVKIAEVLGKTYTSINSRITTLRKKGKIKVIDNRWTDEQNNILINNIGKKTYTELVEMIGKDYTKVVAHTRDLRKKGLIA